MYKYIPLGNEDALKETLKEPAFIYSFLSTSTSSPNKLNIANLTNDGSASEKLIVVAGLKGFG